MITDRTFKPITDKWPDPQRDRFIKFLDKFEGGTETLRELTVKKGLNETRWNYMLPRPLVDDETVYAHPDQSGVADKYVRVVMPSPAGNVVSVFSVWNFTDAQQSTI